MAVVCGAAAWGCTACSAAPHAASPPGTGAPLAPHAATGRSGDVSVASCRQDPTDDTEVSASGTILNSLPEAADYSFTVQWYVGTMRVTQTSYSQTGVPPAAPLGWTTQADVALVSGGPYSCRIVRVIRTPASG